MLERDAGHSHVMDLNPGSHEEDWSTRTENSRAVGFRVFPGAPAMRLRADLLHGNFQELWISDHFKRDEILPWPVHQEKLLIRHITFHPLLSICSAQT